MADQKKQLKPEASSVEPQQANSEYVAFFENVYDRWIDNLFELSDGLSRFAKNRLHRDISSWARLVACRDPKDIVECQKHIAEEMTSRFADDVLTVSQMIATVAANTYRSTPGNVSPS